MKTHSNRSPFLYLYISSSLRLRAEAGGAFPHQQTGTHSSGVLRSGRLGDGAVPPGEQGHAALPQAGAAGVEAAILHRDSLGIQFIFTVNEEKKI